MTNPSLPTEAERPELRRALFVGCGGSGGNTLAYLMDQLRSDLAPFGITQLPPGWQFVFIDAPLSEQNPPSGARRVSSESGVGAYQAVGSTQPYHSVHTKVVTDIINRDSDQTGQLASWASRDPMRVTTPVSEGAGQYRAIGRMLTLSKATEIRNSLEAAWGRLQTMEAHASLESLRQLGGYSRNSFPVVIVVGSMAGGAGASMALDVCRILATINGVKTDATGVFAVTPDLFERLPADQRLGVYANSLAMLGEITASQTGAATDSDNRILTSLGQAGSRDTYPFARIFPVGMYAGLEGTQFGDGTPGPVYRGLARGLAGLITSPSALQQYIAYDLGNTQGWSLQTKEAFGWGTEMDALSWGSFGFASFSMGRDRYMEYAAQRIARTAVDRLEKGHLIPGSTAGGQAQIEQQLDENWEYVCRQVGLPAWPQQAGQWLGEAWPVEQVRNAAAHDVEQVMGAVPHPDGQRGAQWVQMFNARMMETQEIARRTLAEQTYAWAFSWAPQSLFPRLVSAVEDAVSQRGLAYAAALVDRLRSHLDNNIVPALGQLAQSQLPPVNTSDEATLGRMAAMKGTVTNGGGFVERLRMALLDNYTNHLWVEESKLLGPLLTDFANQVLRPLGDELRRKLRVTEQATSARGRVAGLAQLASDHYPDWPSDQDHRPSVRWDEATNDVLLMTSDSYMQRYEVDIASAVTGATNAAAARDQVVFQVLKGIWKTTGGVVPPGGLIEVTRPWVSHALKQDPNDRSRLISPSEASFDIHTTPAEVLGRAKQFVQRPSESFRTFADKSLRAYAEDAYRMAQEDRRPLDELQAKFRQALTRALPLAQINGPLVSDLYGGKKVVYRFKFSSVPFKELPLADLLQRIIEADQNIDQHVVPNNYRGALTDSSQERRIDIFGSYPNLVPLAFQSLLSPIADQWREQTGAQEAASFWSMRRARPLAAALPMGADERRALVAGWYVGLMTGRLRSPITRGRPTREVPAVFDDEKGWLTFPNPLLTPWERFPSATAAAMTGQQGLVDLDWLPSVLESSLVSVVNVKQGLSAREPYSALRRLFDDAPNGPSAGAHVISAQLFLEEWLATGQAPSGGESRLTGETLEERAANATNYLTQVRNSMRALFEPRVGRFGTIDKQEVLAGTPMMRDLADDVIVACDRLLGLMDAAVDGARLRGSGPKPMVSGPGSQDLVF